MIAFLVSGLTFAQEVLLNGGFENWDDANSPTNFTKKENIEKESTEVHSGAFAAKHTGGTKDLGQTVAVTAGNSYTISLWYKTGTTAEGDTTNSRIWAYWKNDDGTIDDNGEELRGPSNSYFTDNTSTWTQYTTTLTAPETATNFYFEVRTYKNAVTYWDDFSVIDNGPSLSIKTNVIPGLTVTANNGTVNTNKGSIVAIYNIVGVQVANQNLAKGVYIITVKENNKVAVKKVLIQ
ncbi:hypothetical protein FHR24_000237 [Wenyingzhuangia heitensis]|uniref:CBM-cenC domain-containing protein n=1 Tax=Wenyingzhuangia heitensis TaxID=1487859 RepID=A0ABX0U4K3_9FLAO|nr:T9SS type A sorting domain-containing protein [Wenyingzhuangia heitensis]NIJ43798.1 hypothetical protein [Wenyingzhuangia heitensis]